MATANNPLESETSVRVRLPPRRYQSKKPQIKDKLTIYFQKSHVSGGCEVEDVNVILEDNSGLWMTVTFTEPFGVTRVLEKHRHELFIDGIVTPIEVHAHVLPGVNSSLAPETSYVSYLQTFRQISDENTTQAQGEIRGAFDEAEWCSGDDTNENDFHDGIISHPENLCSGQTHRQPHDENVPKMAPVDLMEDPAFGSLQDDESGVDLELDVAGDGDACSSGSRFQFHEDNELAFEFGETQVADEMEHEEEDEEELMVKVTGFKPTTSEELLKLYFENPGRSGGGDIKTWEKDSKTNAIRVTFEDQSVAQSVTSGEHTVEGTLLSVVLTVKKPPRPVKRRCLFLSGIPDGCTTEHLSLFLENRSGLDEPKIQYGEMPGTAICTFSEEIPDLEKVIQRICSKKLQVVNLNAEMVHETNCILVEGMLKDYHARTPTGTPNTKPMGQVSKYLSKFMAFLHGFSSGTSLEMIGLYFENKKKSGGGRVEEVEHGTADGQALVYFEDWKVVGDVLTRSKPHIIHKQKLSVEEYHSNLGRLSEDDAPTRHMPKSFSIEVDEKRMVFIFGKGSDMKTRLFKELKRANSVLHWPDGDNKKARIEPLVQDGQRQSSWHNWSEVAVGILHGFLGRCVSQRIPVPQQVWEDVMNKVRRLNSRCYTVEENAQRHIVQLVGEQQAVETGVAQINGIIKEIKGQVEYDAQRIKKEVVLQSIQFQQLTCCGIKEKLEHDFPDIGITTSTKGNQTYIVLEGTRKLVQDAELSMDREMNDLKGIMINTGNAKLLFIQSISDKLHDKLQSKGILVAFTTVGEDRIAIYGPRDADVNQAEEYFGRKIQEEVIPVKTQEAVRSLQSDLGTQLLRKINERDFSAAAQTKDGIAVTGFKSELKEAKDEIMAFLKTNAVTKVCIPMSKSKVLSIVKTFGGELDKFEKENERHHVKISSSSDRTAGFIIEGNQEGLEKARQFINSLESKTEEEQSPSSDEADSPGQGAKGANKMIGRFFSMGANKKENMETQMQPRVHRKAKEPTKSYSSIDTPSLVARSHTRVQTVPPRHLSKAGPTLPRSIVTSSTNDSCYVTSSTNDSCYVTNEGMNVIVRNGDITRQQVQAIVNPTNSSLSGGGVSKAIASAAGTPLKKHCSDLIQNRHQVLPATECVLTPGFNLNCMIIHAVGPAGRGNPNYHQDLSDTFRNCLQMAEENEIPSLAIPLIGSGAAGGSKDACADSLVSAILNFSLQFRKILRDVYLVNIDSESAVAINRALNGRRVRAIQSLP